MKDNASSKQKSQASQLKHALTRLLKGETEVLADPRIIDALPAVVDQLTGKGRTETARALIQGLLARLMESGQKEERSRIVDALARTGPAALPVIGRQMRSDAPWYFLRNLILLLGRIGDESHLDLLQPLLTHDDFRIQREAFSALYQIGGQSRGQRLLSNLDTAKDPTKILIVSMLGRLGHKPAGPVLAGLLHDSRKNALGSVRERLQERICSALGAIGDPSVLPALEKVLKPPTDNLPPFSQGVRDAARKAAANLTRCQPQSQDNGEQGLQDEPSPAPVRDLPKNDFEEKLARLMEKGDTDAAVKQILNAVAEAARAKNFSLAEALRERLFEVDAMALAEIVKAGEIIEAEKSDALDQDHLDQWPDLYETLTGEEANALFFAMTEQVFESNDIILAQGEKNDRLFFINQGLIKAIFRQGSRETLLKDMGRGNIVGHRTFFGISVCTVTLIAQTRVKASVLERSALAGWEASMPALASKLESYSLKMVKMEDLVKGKGVDRRAQKRVDIKGKARIVLLSPSGKPAAKPFRGDLADLSVGGLSFLIRSSKQETVRFLLGRKARISFDIQTPSDSHRMDEKAEVIGIHYLQENEYSLHVRFEGLLDQQIIEALDQGAETAA